jgi:hypothetical protein
MQKAGLEPYVTTWNTLLNAHQKCRSGSDVCALFCKCGSEVSILILTVYPAFSTGFCVVSTAIVALAL